MLFSYHSSPAWSFGGSRKIRKSEQRPAPTTYFESNKLSKTITSWKIGTSNRGRLSLVQPHNPGPGAYETLKKKNPGIKFTKSIRNTEVDDQNPGVGTYTLDTTKKLKRGYYMSNKYKDLTNKQNPGPGAYDTALSSTLKTDFGKMNGAKKLVYKMSDVPGPGTYMQRAQSAGPRMSFSKEKRMKMKVYYNQIGPGKYEVQERFTTDPGKGYSMSGKFQEFPKQATPGPGAYDPKDSTKLSNRSVLIAERFSPRVRPKTPGPGDYSFETRTSFINDLKHGALGKQKRKPLVNPPQTPGPGMYTVHLKPNSPTSPKYSLTGDHELNYDTKNPGPGEYSPNYSPTRVRPSSVKIGSSIRKDPKIEMRPGPGRYNLKGTLEGPSWGFGSELKGSIDFSETPGSNHYNIKSTIADVPSYILSLHN